MNALPILPAVWTYPLDRHREPRPDAADPTDITDALAIVDPTVPDTPAERQRVRAALLCVDPDVARDTYLRIVMSLCSTGWADCEAISREWASGALDGRRAKKFDERHFINDVRGMKIEGGVTLATLYYIAEQHGFDTARAVKPSQQETFGDISNARRFEDKYRGHFLYVHAAGKWLRWTGQHWAACNTGEALKAAQIIAGEALDAAHAALREDPTERTKGNYSAALAVHRNGRRSEAMLTLVAAKAEMSVASPANLDADPYLLGVRNGVLDLKTGTRLVAKPAMLITRQAGAAFDPDAECPRWMQFLGQVFSDDADLIAFIQRAVGYSLTGSVDEEVMFFLLGNGANGKSVFANILQEIFGDYAVTVRSKMLARDNKGNSGDAEREKARLPGARLALINEVGHNDAFDDQQVKEIVSRERIAARMLYGESFDFMPTHAIWMRGNHQPIIRDAGDGMWRRILLIRFERQFAESERKRNLEQDILNFERDGILAWAVRGCLEWQHSGLGVPAAVRQAGDEYRHDSDVMGEWVEAHCIRNSSAATPTATLYRSYCSYLHDAGMQPPTLPSFGKQLGARGFKRQRTSRARSIQGLVLRPWGDDDETL